MPIYAPMHLRQLFSKNVPITEGPILKNLLKLGAPLVLGNLLQQLYSIADIYWLGRLGKSAVAAPVVSFPILFLFISIATGFSMAGTSLIAQYVGKGNHHGISRVAGQVVLTMLGFAMIVVVLGVFLADPVLELIHTPTEILPNVTIYMKILFAGMPALFLYFVYSGIMQGYGDTVSPLIVQVISVTINVVLDPFMIFGWGPFPVMGVAGAATATVVARSFAALVGLGFLISKRFGVKLRFSDLRPDRKLIRDIFAIGIPGSVGQTATAMGFIIMNGIVNSFGTIVITAYGVVNRLTMLFLFPAMGIGQAATTFIGQNLGAGKHERARDTVTKGAIFVFVYLTIGMTLTFFFGHYFISFFIPNDPEVIATGAEFIRILAFSVVVFGSMFLPQAAFQGAGHTKPIMIINIIRLWGIRLPLAYLLAITAGMGAVGIWWGMFISNVVSTSLYWIWYARGSWEHHYIKREQLDLRASVDAEYRPSKRL